jgi:ComF family protein
MLKLYDQLLDLVFPPRCPGCRLRGTQFCTRCVARCRRLRNTLSAPTGITRLAPLRSAVALYHYDAPLREAIHWLKYRRRRALAGPLGTLCVEALPRRVHDCGMIVPVPLHRTRERERGFNQSALLAEAIAGALQAPLTRYLQRLRATAHQVGMDRRAREVNVQGAFVWCGPDIREPVLLVDDVLTTGSTMRACAHALRAAGAPEVHGLALAGEWM